MTEKDEFLETAALVEIMNNRGSIYGFLSQIFLREISEGFLQEIFLRKDISFINKSTNKEGNDFEKGLSLFSQAVEQFKEGGETSETIKLLGREFVYTFIVKGSHSVHPYESVYLGEEKLLMQKPYEEVRAMFRAAGVKRSEECQEIEDHIGIELEFMSILCLNFIDAWKDKKREEALKFLRLQKGFLSEHLSKWVPQLCEDILKKTRMDFYRGIAYLTRGFITIDNEELEKIIRALEKA